MTRILITEDDPLMAEIYRDSFNSEGFVTEVASDGLIAMQRLKQNPPDLVLLDLNLPRKDGREVLTEIKGDECLRRIPVVILTTSQAEEDIAKAYHLNANCYITKPVDLEQFMRVIRTIKDFWLTVVKLPSESGP